MRLPGNRHVVRQVVHGVDPHAVLLAGGVDDDHARGLDGRHGAVRAGGPGAPSRRYDGHLVPVQDFRGGAMVGSSRSVAAGFNTALPATSGNGRPLEDAPTLLDPLLWGMGS